MTMSSATREHLRQRLLRLMAEHELTVWTVGALVHVSPHTVEAWRKPATSSSSNPVPLWAIELLEHKVKDR